MEPERTDDLGERAIPAELEIGKKYYYRTFGPYMKLTITRIQIGPTGYMWVDGIYENGNEVGPLGIDTTNYNKFYHINPKPVQRAIGEIFTLKTPLSSAPGKGPANLVRKFLDVQPPKVPAVAEANSRRNRKRRNSRKTRKTRKNRRT